MKKKILLKLGFWLPPLLWAFLIFRFSSGQVPLASAVYWQDFAVKKTGHVILFGFLAILIYRALRGEGVERKKAVIWSVGLATFYGATDEYHQMFTQGREAMVRDIFIDGAGAGVAALFAYHVLPKLPKKLKIMAERLYLL